MVVWREIEVCCLQTQPNLLITSFAGFLLLHEELIRNTHVTADFGLRGWSFAETFDEGTKSQQKTAKEAVY